MSSRNTFDLSACSSLESVDLLHKSELSIFKSDSKHSEPTPFESFMEQFAQSDRLHRHYTQNVNGRTHKLPELSRKTHTRHDRLDRMRCHIYSHHTVSVTRRSFQELLGTQCLICDEENDGRSKIGKRLDGVGFLQPNVLCRIRVTLQMLKL